jgi:hypothetical protein
MTSTVKIRAYQAVVCWVLDGKGFTKTFVAGYIPPTADPGTTTNDPDWKPDPDCPWPSNDRYLFPYPGDCTKFLECVLGEKTVVDCPDGLWFNPTLLVCDYPYHSGCIF